MMIKLSVYSFLTGLYLAVLQFGFVILLQINISSTYLTYVLIVASWLVGSLAGLWLKRLEGGLGLVLSLLSYYAVYGLVTQWPFGQVTLFLSALGAGIAGLWAGNFFVFMIGRFKSVGSLFFHENNGFLLGIFIFFLGFTQLGRDFIIWMPGVWGSMLLILHYWIIRFSPVV